MRKLFFLLFLFFTASAWASPSSILYFSTSTVQAGTIPNNGATNQVNSGALFHQLTWTKSGTVSTCQVEVDSSSDGVSWNNADVISSQLCTSNGSSAVINSGPYTYIRINVTAISGGGSIFVAYDGYTSNPSGVGFPINPTTGQSISPTNLGQNVATQLWFNVSFTAPTLTANASGGSLPVSHSIGVTYTLNSAAGETNPSALALVTTPGACGGSFCSVTVTAPFLPPGFTGYTVYSYDGNAGGTFPLKQLASNACVNISGNCVIQVVGAGAQAPSANTAYLQPPGALGTLTCSPNTQPFMFLADATGTYYEYMGLDGANTGSNPPAPYNKLSICRPLWINDTGTDPPSGRNSLQLVFHNQNGTITNSANQDRGMFIYTQNPTTDTSGNSHYALEGIQAEQDFNGNATVINGSPDGEVTAGSFQLSDVHTGSVTHPNVYGVNGVRTEYFRNTSGTYGSCGVTCANGIYALATNTIAATNGGNGMAAGAFLARDSSGAATSIFGYDLYAAFPGAGQRFANGTFGLWIDNFGSNTKDYGIYAAGSQHLFQGAFTVSEVAEQFSSAPSVTTGALFTLKPGSNAQDLLFAKRFTDSTPSGNFLHYQTAAAADLFTLDVTGKISPTSYASQSNCASGASPSVCGSAASGSGAIPTGTNPTLVVQTTAVTANSVILITQDMSLGTKLSVTCNTSGNTNNVTIVTARSPGTSFTVQQPTTVTTNPICFNWWVIN